MVANLLVHSFLLLWPQWGFCSPQTLGIKKEEVQSLSRLQALCTLFAHRCPKQFMPWWAHTAARGKPCLKYLTILLRTVQTIHLPTTLTALLIMPQCFVAGLNRTFLAFKHSWRTNVSSSSALLMWYTWARNTPLESGKPSLVLSPVPQDSIPCSHQPGEGKPWGRGWTERQCVCLSSHKRPLHEGFKG